MLDFNPISLEHRQLIHQNMYEANGYGCEYSFANLYLWGDQRMAMIGSTPVILTRYGKWYSYLLPQCKDRFSLLQILREDAHERNIPFRIFGLTAEDKNTLESAYPGEFRFRSLRDSYDYVYDIVRLTGLHGKKLQAKRNHCNRFEQDYPDYRVLPLTQETLPLCRAFAKSWYEEHLAMHPYSDMTEEQSALNKAFDNFSQLQMEGIAIDTPDGIVAFSMGNRIRKDTFDVNFEKALAEINGAYPMVNREFARRIHAKYPEVCFLNREDDMGIEGLRKAKESYYPDTLLEKIVAEEK